MLYYIIVLETFFFFVGLHLENVPYIVMIKLLIVVTITALCSGGYTYYHEFIWSLMIKNLIMLWIAVFNMGVRERERAVTFAWHEM